MEIDSIDWNEVWKEKQQRRRQRRKERRDEQRAWDERALEFTKVVTKSDYISQFFAKLNPQPDWTVLDVGAAAGTLAVPLAARVKSITALEPSTRMRELMDKRCQEKGIGNIKVVDGRWQDDWHGLGIKPHDVLIASRSLMVDDLREAVEKMNRFATKRVMLSTLVGDGPHDRKIVEAAGREHIPGADYIVVMNLLYQMGIFPNLSFTCTCEEKRFADLEQAVADMRWMLRGVSEEEESRLRKHLRNTLLSCQGGLVMPYPRKVRWAVIWWDKEENCPKRRKQE